MKQVYFASLLMLMSVGIVHAQKAYTYVQQNNTKIEKLGTAAFDVSADSHPTFAFVDGKVVMKIGDNVVAKLPMSDKGQLVVEFTTSMEESELNKVTKTYSDDFATLYSPFQLAVPASAVEVYAPIYDATKAELICNGETQIPYKAVIPAETALLLKNAGTVTFGISAGSSTVTPESALSGSSLLIDVPATKSGQTLYTLGHESTDNTQYGFFQYTGTQLNPGLAWLVAPDISASQAKYVHFNFGDATAIANIDADTSQMTGHDGKYIVNGSIIILRNGKKYNINGQNIK